MYSLLCRAESCVCEKLYCASVELYPEADDDLGEVLVALVPAIMPQFLEHRYNVKEQIRQGTH